MAFGSGGKDFHYIPTTNDTPAWMPAISIIALENLQGWAPPPRVGHLRHGNPAAAEWSTARSRGTCRAAPRRAVLGTTEGE